MIPPDGVSLPYVGWPEHTIVMSKRDEDRRETNISFTISDEKLVPSEA